MPRTILTHLANCWPILAVTGLTNARSSSFVRSGIGHPLVIGGGALAVLAGIAFYFVETKSSEPMLPMGLFQLPNFSPAVIFGTLMNLSFYGMIFVLSLYLHLKRGAIRRWALGLAYLPLMCTIHCFQQLASSIVKASQVGPRLPTLILGSFGTLAGFAMLSQFGPTTPYYAMLLPFIVIPSGMGLAIPAMTATVLSSVDRTQSGTLRR